MPNPPLIGLFLLGAALLLIIYTIKVKINPNKKACLSPYSEYYPKTSCNTTTKIPTMVAVISGGCFRGLFSNGKEIDCGIIDWDNIGDGDIGCISEDDIEALPIYACAELREKIAKIKQKMEQSEYA